MTVVEILTKIANKELTMEESLKHLPRPKYHLQVAENYSIGIWIDKKTERQEACVIFMDIAIKDKVGLVSVSRAKIIPLNMIGKIYEENMKGESDEKEKIVLPVSHDPNAH